MAVFCQTRTTSVTWSHFFLLTKSIFLMCGSRGGGGGRGSGRPLENYKNIGFLSNTAPDHLKITKLPIQHSMLGHHVIIGPPTFKWRFAGRWWMSRYSGIWIIPPLIKLKKQKRERERKKNKKKPCFSWTPL